MCVLQSLLGAGGNLIHPGFSGGQMHVLENWLVLWVSMEKKKPKVISLRTGSAPILSTKISAHFFDMFCRSIQNCDHFMGWSHQFYVPRGKVVVMSLLSLLWLLSFLSFSLATFRWPRLPIVPLWTPILIILEGSEPSVSSITWHICCSLSFLFLKSEFMILFFSDYCFEKKDSTEFRLCGTWLGER